MPFVLTLSSLASRPLFSHTRVHTCRARLPCPGLHGLPQQAPAPCPGRSAPLLCRGTWGPRWTLIVPICSTWCRGGHSAFQDLGQDLGRPAASSPPVDMAQTPLMAMWSWSGLMLLASVLQVKRGFTVGLASEKHLLMHRLSLCLKVKWRLCTQLRALPLAHQATWTCREIFRGISFLSTDYFHTRK